jgi:2-methylisocitrate lyase-like PEP mutase family enzyme
VVPGAFCALSAKLAYDAGFEAVYLSGGQTSCYFVGYADVGMITFSEMIQNVRLMVDRVNIPLIADADTGYGNALNVRRTAQAYVRSGAAAMHIEDQTFPKRCGHLAGKTVIESEEFAGKVKAARDVIGEMDEDFVLIARTDARNAVGGSLQEAIDRSNLYAESGADVVIPDGLQSPEEVKKFTGSVKAPTMLFAGYGIKYDSMTAKDFEVAGVKIVAFTDVQSSPALFAQVEALKLLKEYGTDMKNKHRMFDCREMFDMAGLREYVAYENKYLPKKELDKYKTSTGL